MSAAMQDVRELQQEYDTIDSNNSLTGEVLYDVDDVVSLFVSVWTLVLVIIIILF